MKDKECCGGGCGHNHHHHHPSIEDITYNNHFLLNTLIKHLIDKKIISKDELEQEISEVAKAQQEHIVEDSDHEK